MRETLKHAGRLMAALTLGAMVCAPVMAADSGFDTQFKLRTGLQIGDSKDELDRRVMGAGLDVGYTTSLGRFGLELGYQYKSGGERTLGANEYTLAGALPHPVSATYPIRVLGSQKNSLQGITARLSYSRPLNETWGFQGGVQLGGARFRQDAIGEVDQLSYANPARPVYVWRDSYLAHPTKNVIAVSPFVGVSFRLNDFASIEANVIGISYKAIEYIHVAGTAPTSTAGGHVDQDYIKENNRMLPHVEVGFVFRF